MLFADLGEATGDEAVEASLSESSSSLCCVVRLLGLGVGWELGAELVEGVGVGPAGVAEVEGLGVEGVEA